MLETWQLSTKYLTKNSLENRWRSPKYSKKDVGYVVELEVIKPVNAQLGIVGQQGSAPGGANQINFLFPPREGAQFFKVVGKKELP
jgi:hypothetical protein